MPMSGVPAEAARRILESFLDKDLDPKLNLATWVHIVFVSFHLIIQSPGSLLPVSMNCRSIYYAKH